MAQVRTPERAAYERNRLLVKRYGITSEEYDAMLAEQGGLCAVCQRENLHTRRMHVDHDHETGRVRGILCHSCNVLLGVADDDADRLMAAVAYLLGAS